MAEIGANIGDITLAPGDHIKDPNLQPVAHDPLPTIEVPLSPLPIRIAEQPLHPGEPPFIPNNPEQEKWREEHKKYHEKHKGHDSMHASMILVLFITLIVAQILLVNWRRWHFRSFQMMTLFAMWLIPCVMSIKFLWFRFLIVWVIFTLCNCYIWYIASRKIIAGTTPRRVYKWFLFVYKASYVTGLGGYLIIMFSLFGLSLVFLIQPNTAVEFGILLLFYGLYYGVVARDFAELCTELMASQIGYYKKEGMPTRTLDRNVCAVCGQRLGTAEIERMRSQEEVERELRVNSHLALPQNYYASPYSNANAPPDTYSYEGGANSAAAAAALAEAFDKEKTYKLACEHSFHEFCIRGWCVIGKKQTCPYCKEKVDLRRLFTSPWERPHLLYGSLLDWIRYLVAWLPIIVGLVQGLNWLFGLE